MEIRTKESKMCAGVAEQEPVQDTMGAGVEERKTVQIAAGHEDMQKTIGVAKQGDIQEGRGDSANSAQQKTMGAAGIRHEYVNEMSLTFDAVSLNESFARVVVAAFITPLNPTVEELADVKTAVSEAVTNAIIHGYDSRGGKIRMYCMVTGNLLSVRIEDDGAGIADIEQAMMPLYTTRPELERSGMGFAFMEAFMDDLKVESRLGEGTKVSMMKRVGDAIRTA